MSFLMHQGSTFKACTLVLAIVLSGWWPPATAEAQDQPPRSLQDLLDADLEDLLEVEVVSTASRFQQEVREAPAAITVVTAEEIRRFGHRTLSDVLRSVRGFYTTYDRNYSYIGVRGFARPGDYNTRILMLLDGHRLNDAVYDMAPIGTDFPVDISLIDRVEVIRGPGSSLYGTSAFFAVVNVITRAGGSAEGVRVDAVAGSLGTTGGTVSYGRVFSGNSEALLAVSGYRADGQRHLVFPEFDGEAVDLDRDESVGLTGSFSAGRMSFRGGFGDRRKRVPTASFVTAFGDPRYATTDRRGYVIAEYDGALAGGWLGNGKVSYDYYGFEGLYPLDYGSGQTSLWLDAAQSQTVAGELTVRRRLGSAQLFTGGVEIRRQFRNDMLARDETGVVLDVHRPATVVGFYVQDEVRLRPWLLVNAGARVDRYAGFGHYAAPRVGVVLLPRPRTSVKLLYGRAFRAPNPYEMYYYAAMEELGLALRPERIRSTEAVWEESFGGRVRAVVTAFEYHAQDIIELASIDGQGVEFYFANAGGVESSGVEAELEARLPRGISARISHSYTRARHAGEDVPVSNSPTHLAKLAFQIPIARMTLGLEGQYVSERLTIRQETLPGVFLPNVALTAPIGRRLELTAGIYNAFNASYSDPGAEEHVQRSIPQDGRTALVRARVRF